MKHPQNPRMQELLAVRQARQLQLDAVKAKTDLRANMPFFDVRYRFAAPEEISRIQKMLGRIPCLPDGTPDADQLQDVRSVPLAAHSGKAWLCFLDAGPVYCELYLCGAADDIARDYAKWAAISPRLLLLLGDWRHFLLMDGTENVMQAALPAAAEN